MAVLVIDKELLERMDEQEREIEKLRSQLEHYKELFRCAEAYVAAKDNNPEQNDFSDYLVDLKDAVRAAKEGKE